MHLRGSLQSCTVTQQTQIGSVKEFAIGAEQVMRVASYLLDDVLLNCVRQL